MFIREDPVLVAVMKSLRSVDISDFKSKYKNESIGLCD